MAPSRGSPVAPSREELVSVRKGASFVVLLGEGFPLTGSRCTALDGSAGCEVPSAAVEVVADGAFTG